jgi:hypothetical protein
MVHGSAGIKTGGANEAITLLPELLPVLELAEIFCPGSPNCPV